MTDEAKHKANEDFSVGSSADAFHTAGGSGAALSEKAANKRVKHTMLSGRKNRNKAFWTMQTLGWLGYVPIRLFGGVATGRDPVDYIWVSLSAALIGFILTIILRFIYRSIQGRPLWVVISTASVLSTILGLGFSVIETLIWVQELEIGIALFGNAIFESTVLFAWSSMYFGFHYYDDLQKQRQKALKAVALAQQAQLTMLRYQLNPHFLFNTLNAISTLVLESDGVSANKMLTKLSSFLRYTLVNQPTQKVSVNQELYPLKLYLEIEKVRFEERLNIVYEIADDAKEALIPSLILQPHIENAIKYAIAPSETGGTLKIIARLDGRHLIMSIEDDGPGMDDPDKPISKSSSGVGIVNTRERLNHIYGDKHAFFIQNIEPVGLRIWMKIPFEKEDDSKKNTSIG